MSKDETIVTGGDRIVTAQGRAFEKMARELECDEDEAVFEDRVRKVAAAPKPEAEPDGN